MSAHVYNSPVVSQGTTLAMKAAGASGTATAVAWIKSVKNDWSQGIIEWMNLAQTAKRRMASGVFDGGEVSVSGQYCAGDASAVLLQAAFLGATMQTWTETLTDGTVISYNGIVSKLGPSIEEEDEVDFDMTISVDGPVTITPPAS